MPQGKKTTDFYENTGQKKLFTQASLKVTQPK